MSLMSLSPESRGTKRKREPTRRRTALACNICRKLKEKCEGGSPCYRCQRLGRACQFPAHNSCKNIISPTSQESTSEISDHQHLQNLENIAQHFLGNISLDKESVSRIAAKCSAKGSEVESALDVNESFDVHFVSKHVAFYSGEFSHWNFSEKLRRTMSSDCEGDLDPIQEYWRPTHLQSSIQIVAEAITQLPPRTIAEFLINVFFKYAEVNSFYIERGWIQEKLHICYLSNSHYSASDIPWVCSLFAVLAIGTQMAHMEDLSKADPGDAEITICSEDSVGIDFYHVACRLLPDVILSASHESVQTFLLLGIWALPVSAGGLSWTYLGLAMKMAIQNGMHRKYDGDECDPVTIETRNRLFWTVYTLEKRISIMHGRPSSISRAEINTDLPTDCPAFASPNFSNIISFIDLVSWTGEVAETLAQFKRCPKRLLLEYSERLIELRVSIRQWWDSPANTECRDTNPQVQVFRQNSHLRLCYLQIFIYMGRPFIFNSRRHGSDAHQDTIKALEAQSQLVNDCVQSALDILATLQSLADNIGLCRASYTEFSSCRAALLVLLAESLNSGNSHRLQEGLSRGMALIHQMTGGTASKSEISYIKSIQAAMRQLLSKDPHHKTDIQSHSGQSPASAYAKFKDWTQFMKKDKRGGSTELSSFSPISNRAQSTEKGFSELNELAKLLDSNWPTNDMELNFLDL